MLFLFKKPATLTLSAKIITFFRLPKHSSGKTVIRHKLPILRAFAMSFVTEGCKISQNFGRLADKA